LYVTLFLFLLPKKNSDHLYSYTDSTMVDINLVVDDIWKELLEASQIEAPMNAKPYYDDMVKKEDGNKVFQDFKKPSMMTTDDYNSVPAKINWNSNIKYSCHSINKDSADQSVRLYHLLMLTAFKLKIFGDDSYGKVSTWYKVGANIVNNLLERNTVFFLLVLQKFAYLCVYAL
jgi:hypothetical protein